MRNMTGTAAARGTGITTGIAVTTGTGVAIGIAVMTGTAIATGRATTTRPGTTMRNLGTTRRRVTTGTGRDSITARITGRTGITRIAGFAANTCRVRTTRGPM